MPRLTSKGQVTIPKPIRDALGLNSGDEVLFDLEGDKCHLRRANGPEAISAWVGALRNSGRTDEWIEAFRGPAEL